MKHYANYLHFCTRSCRPRWSVKVQPTVWESKTLLSAFYFHIRLASSRVRTTHQPGFTQMSFPEKTPRKDSNQDLLIPGLSAESGGTSNRESERDCHQNRMGTGPSRESEWNPNPSQFGTGPFSDSKLNRGESSSCGGAGSYHGPESEPKWETFPIENMKKEPACHMELDHLEASSKHTVLIDTRELRLGRIVPYKTQPMWHHDFVKLPPEYPGTMFDSRWGTTKKALQRLTKGHASVQDVEKEIKSYNEGHRRLWNFTALQTYFRDTHYHERERIPGVIARMAELALKLPELIKHPIPLLRRGKNHSITMSQEQIACLLAHAFFCTFPHRNTKKPGSEYANFPTINFSSLLSDACTRKTEKLKALFHYFNTVTTPSKKPEGLVTFERICVLASELPEWQRSKDHLTNLHVSADGLIEREGKGMLQVDFACKFIGGGVLGRGLVQEEIRFLQCPELIVSRLFTEKLEDNECLKITGVQKYNDTSGYSDSFVWKGPHTDDTKSDKWKRRFCQIVAIDALSFSYPAQQYSPEKIKRELNKAYVGFRGDQQTPHDYISAIATGNWGCGAFKGDHRLKALIQMMAAAVARRDLAYFTFKNKHQAEELQGMYDLMKARNVTVGKLYHLLKDYCSYYHSRRTDRPKNVFEFVTMQLSTSHL